MDKFRGIELIPLGRVRPFRFFEKGGLADGSEGENRPDHQRLSRNGQHRADNGFERTHLIVSGSSEYADPAQIRLLRFVAILLRAGLIAFDAIVTGAPRSNQHGDDSSNETPGRGARAQRNGWPLSFHLSRICESSVRPPAGVVGAVATGGLT